MKFSLILATLGRTTEVKYFLHSLDRQTFRSFELIVVDQNLDDCLLPILEPYRDRFPIYHLSASPGLSHARNVALEMIKGDIVAFPDDDCAYLPDLLERVASFFESCPQWNGLTGRSIDQQGAATANCDRHAGRINRFNVWQRGISYTIFLRHDVVKKTGRFDESLGVGAKTPWGSGEETDYLLRALSTDLYYDPTFTVIHPVKVTPDIVAPEPAMAKPRANHQKTYAYAMGRGRVLRKHQAPLWFVFYHLARPLLGMILSVLLGRVERIKSYWATLRGRMQGWLNFVEPHRS